MRTIQQLIHALPNAQVIGNTNTTVLHLTYDSRMVGEGSLFFAVKGTQVDGHKYIADVIEKGTAAIVCEVLPEELNETVTYIIVNNTSEAMGLMAAEFYDHPSKKLKLTAITGTNGKTTVATLLFRLFRSFGHNVGLLSTVQNQINDLVIPSTHTTPNPLDLNALLNDMVLSGCDYCFMEVSSHAVAQARIEGLEFAGGIFTNLTHDHLDFHKTFDSYLKAKKGFFDGLSNKAFALTNVDDKNGMVMLQNSQGHKNGGPIT
jgi:UDP-N-acetylmuramoyl-L-alanyl-D-glutamate--2,6-diaminopimelate ligase